MSSLEEQSALSLYIEELDRFVFVNATPGTQPTYRIIGPKTQDVFSNKLIRAVDNDVEASALCEQGTMNRQVIKNSPVRRGQCLYSMDDGNVEWRDSPMSALNDVTDRIIDLEQKFTIDSFEGKAVMEELMDEMSKMKMTIASLNNKISELTKKIESNDNKIAEFAKGTELVDMASNDEITGTSMSNIEAKSIIDEIEPIIDEHGEVHISGNISKNIGALSIAVKSLQRREK